MKEWKPKDGRLREYRMNVVLLRPWAHDRFAPPARAETHHMPEQGPGSDRDLHRPDLRGPGLHLVINGRLPSSVFTAGIAGTGLHRGWGLSLPPYGPGRLHGPLCSDGPYCGLSDGWLCNDGDCRKCNFARVYLEQTLPDYRWRVQKKMGREEPVGTGT